MTTDCADELLRITQISYDKAEKNVIQSYVRNKNSYAKKAGASSLQKKIFFYIPLHKMDHQGSKVPFLDFRWIGTFVIEKVLPNNNCVVRQINTNETQFLPRYSLRICNSDETLDDSTHHNKKLEREENIVVPQDHLYTIARDTEFLNIQYPTENLMSLIQAELSKKLHLLTSETKKLMEVKNSSLTHKLTAQLLVM